MKKLSCIVFFSLISPLLTYGGEKPLKCPLTIDDADFILRGPPEGGAGSTELTGIKLKKYGKTHENTISDSPVEGVPSITGRDGEVSLQLTEINIASYGILNLEYEFENFCFYRSKDRSIRLQFKKLKPTSNKQNDNGEQ